MDIVGRRVLHSKFGCGIISWFGGKNDTEKKYIRVQFDDKTVEFPYPSAFRKYIFAIDEDFSHFVED